MHKMAPAFEVTALDGAKFNLDAMGGTVVLIDFWATWCGPCNEELPELKKIAKEFAGQPFVMISVSADKDEAVWREFVEKHGMTWVQYRDVDHKLEDEFGVTAIPHYFTIDSDGVLTSERMGEGSDVEEQAEEVDCKGGRGEGGGAGRSAECGRAGWQKAGGRRAGEPGSCGILRCRIASKAETGLQSRYGEYRRLNQYSLNRVSARIHGSVC